MYCIIIPGSSAVLLPCSRLWELSKAAQSVPRPARLMAALFWVTLCIVLVSQLESS